MNLRKTWGKFYSIDILQTSLCTCELIHGIFARGSHWWHRRRNSSSKCQVDIDMPYPETLKYYEYTEFFINDILSKILVIF